MELPLVISIALGESSKGICCLLVLPCYRGIMSYVESECLKGDTKLLFTGSSILLSQLIFTDDVLVFLRADRR